jgi:hypothetical protein
MGYPLKSLCLGTVAAALTLSVWMLAAPAAQAFTIENKDQDGTGAYAVPKFDLQEQARQFSSSGGSGNMTPGKTDFSTPLGNGTMQFGVQQGPSFGSGMGFGAGSLGPVNGSRAGRADFDRMVTPDGLR